MSTIESIRRTLAQFIGALEEPAIPHPRAAVTAMWNAYGRLQHHWRSRRALEMLDDHGLRDIGVTREQARREAARGFWD